MTMHNEKIERVIKYFETLSNFELNDGTTYKDSFPDEYAAILTALQPAKPTGDKP